MFSEDPNFAKFALISIFFAILLGLFFKYMIKFKQDEKAAAKQKAEEEAKSAREMQQAFDFDELCTRGNNKPGGYYKNFGETEMMSDTL